MKQYTDLTIGILGGGQLGRMMIAASEKLGLSYQILDPDREASCQGISQFTKGSYADFDQVLAFGRHVDCITTEIEHVNTEALRLLENQIPVYPQPAILEIIQDKGLQKQFYKDNQLPSADFVLIEHATQLSEHADMFPAVQKLRRQGYDGRGVICLDSPEESGFTEPSILEKRIDIDKEISVLTCRDQYGKVITYTPVEMVVDPQKNILTQLRSPSTLAQNIAQRCTNLAREVTEKIGIVGMLAVELMVDKNQTIWINEIAPRPHNSGHHTIESASASQFEQHIRAVIGAPIADISWEKPAAMCNLLGGDTAGLAHWTGLDEVLKTPEAHLHLYGKRYTKPNRKMGHLTVVADSAEEALRILNQLSATISCNGHPVE
jgi:5-(carboxyamino)imidazole ribonucleotide synthase